MSLTKLLPQPLKAPQLLLLLLLMPAILRSCFRLVEQQRKTPLCISYDTLDILGISEHMETPPHRAEVNYVRDRQILRCRCHRRLHFRGSGRHCIYSQLRAMLYFWTTLRSFHTQLSSPIYFSP